MKARETTNKKKAYADMTGEMEITFNRIQHFYNEIENKPTTIEACIYKLTQR